MVALAIVATTAGILSSRRMRCKKYKHALRIENGVLFQSEKNVWLYEIENVIFRRNPWQQLLNTATLELVVARPMGMRSETLKAVSIGSARDLREICDVLRLESIRERREMKANFV